MFDLSKIDSATLNSLMLSVAFLGVLLLVGVGLRLAVPLLRKYLIPSALIGGALGLALGPYGFGLVSKELNSTWAAIPGLLIAVVFAPMLMGQ